MKLTVETFIDELTRANGAVYGFTTERQGNEPSGTGLDPIRGWIQGVPPALGTPVTITVEWADSDS